MKTSIDARTHTNANSEGQESLWEEGKSMSPPAFSLTTGPAVPPEDDSKQRKMSGPSPEQLGGDNKKQVTNPNAIIPIADLLRYVKIVEAAFPEDSPKQILTRIRSEYYGSLAFSRLIPDAPDLKTQTPRLDIESHDQSQTGNPRFDKQNANQEGLFKEAYEHLTAHGDENGKGDNPSPFILLENGEMVDLGHLLLGLDALAHPATVAPYSTYGIPNIDPSSWVADLGIAAVWMERHEVDGHAPKDAPRVLPSPDLDAYYLMSAPEADLLGDVDSFGMGKAASENPNEPLSSILAKYYLGDAGTGTTVDCRWKTFCEMNALEFSSNGKSINWSPEIFSHLIPRINRFNDLFADGAILVGARLSMSWVQTPMKTEWKYTAAVLSKFLEFVKSKLEAEISRTTLPNPK